MGLPDRVLGALDAESSRRARRAPIEEDGCDDHNRADDDLLRTHLRIPEYESEALPSRSTRSTDRASRTGKRIPAGSDGLSVIALLGSFSAGFSNRWPGFRLGSAWLSLRITNRSVVFRASRLIRSSTLFRMKSLNPSRRNRLMSNSPGPNPLGTLTEIDSRRRLVSDLPHRAPRETGVGLHFKFAILDQDSTRIGVAQL